MLSYLSKYVKQYFLLGILLLITFSLLAHFFNYFAYGWDQLEYSWAIRENYLPHGPYLLFFIAGKALSLIFDAHIALSVLSCLSGVLIVILYYSINRRLSPLYSGDYIAMRAFTAAALLALSYAFIRQATTQEVYVFQTFLIFLALWKLLSLSRCSAVYSGVIYGFALASHYSSLFLLPAFLYGVYMLRRGNVYSEMVFWSSGVVLVFIASLVSLYALVPVPHGEETLPYLLSYLRGISPDFKLSTSPSFWARSVKDLVWRLISLDIGISYQPGAESPVGLSAAHLLATLVGFFVVIKVKSSHAIFWFLYGMPYVIYELALGKNIDYGLYVPFILPPVCYFTSVAVVFASGLGIISQRRIDRGCYCY